MILFLYKDIDVYMYGDTYTKYTMSINNELFSKYQLSNQDDIRLDGNTVILEKGTVSEKQFPNMDSFYSYYEKYKLPLHLHRIINHVIDNGYTKHSIPILAEIKAVLKELNRDHQTITKLKATIANQNFTSKFHFGHEVAPEIIIQMMEQLLLLELAENQYSMTERGQRLLQTPIQETNVDNYNKGAAEPNRCRKCNKVIGVATATSIEDIGRGQFAAFHRIVDGNNNRLCFSCRREELKQYGYIE